MRALKDWIDFMIDNQEGLMKEYDGLPFPEWNKGYYEALRDCKNEFAMIEAQLKDEAYVCGMEVLRGIR